MAQFACAALVAVLLTSTGAKGQTVTTAYPENCSKVCAKIIQPVCGSDGKTYDNVCLLEIATCQTNGQVKKVSDSACVIAYAEPQPPPDPCARICTMEYAPVCGTDGKVYGNKCTLGVATCKSGVQFAYEGECIATPTPTVCTKICSKDLQPVCGTDRITYDNLCLLEIATCQSNGKTTKAADGPCTGGPDPLPDPCLRPCTANLKPVCGSNRVTYDNQCLLEIATCQSSGKITKAADGPCTGGPDPLPDTCIKACTKELQLVCGSNGATYNNMCLLEIATCQTGVTKVADGPCTGVLCIKPCTKDLRPVCGSDGKTYDNVCLFEIGNCLAGGVLSVSSSSPCTAPPPAPSCVKPCTKDLRPVCGSDGKTYSNQCLLDIAACQSGVRKVSDGACGTPPPPVQPDSCLKPCTADIRPVCGSDGKTYDNICLFETANCKAGGYLSVISNSACGPPTPSPPCIKLCYRDLRPVCGSNGVTYANQCLLDIAACQSAGQITKASNGSCPSPPPPPVADTCTKPCTKELASKCGSNGVTYANQCLFEIAVCQSGGSLTKVSDAACVPAGGSYVRCRNPRNCANALGGEVQDWVCVAPVYCRPMTCQMVDWRPTVCGPRTCQFSNRTPIRYGYCRPRANSY